MCEDAEQKDGAAWASDGCGPQTTLVRPSPTLVSWERHGQLTPVLLTVGGVLVLQAQPLGEAGAGRTHRVWEQLMVPRQSRGLRVGPMGLAAAGGAVPPNATTEVMWLLVHLRKTRWLSRGADVACRTMM